MPGEVIDRPNPEAMPSGLPDSINELAVRIEKTPLPEADSESIKQFRRAACYIAAGMLVNDNSLGAAY
jgi:xylulose-5-phosphate/fructose-6-phosphate phosphoketolase